MEVKEVAEFLRYDHKYGLNRKSTFNMRKHKEEIQKIISLLQERDKYKDMWEELKDRNMCGSRPDGQYLDDEDFEELEEKYLKEVKGNEYKQG